MKTTLNIDDGVMRQLKAVAAQRQTTMSALVEAGLRRFLAEPAHDDLQRQPQTPLPTWRSGGFRVDIANRDALYRLLDEE
ncbi:MAG: type II toxin-antitoxin system VapB family antitoxin [Gammaproteobacteria bacterium]|nr:type II toxin-antitoxin system VapB family antitoxin [Gammaproteobacteria bacterium]